MVAERLRDDGGWGLKDELPDRGSPAALRRGTDLAKVGLQAARIHRLPGLAAGEEPSGTSAAGIGQVLAGVDVGPDQSGDGFRKGRRWISQTDGDSGAVGSDVVDGEANDAADRLGTEENEGGNGAAPRGQGAVVEDPSEDGESAVLVQWRLVLGDDLGRKGEAGHPAGLHAPAEEGLGWASGGRFLGVPGIKVGLSTVLDGATSVGEPDQEGAGLGGLLLGLVSLGTSQRPLLRGGP
ncbi:hypothetical protein [Streptomyces halstedii]|uniref:hypothetical protein n=1 Tax=Streptomyces halstedii TaxID=1944 RepID=UPI00335A8C4C